MLHDERIGEVPGLLQDRNGLAVRAAILELDRRDDSLADPMIEILEENEGAALPFDRKGIGEEARPGVRQHLPARPREVAPLQHAGAVVPAPAHAPVR